MVLEHALVDGDISEEAIAALVDEVRRCPERRLALVDLLPERLALYAGRSTNATIRIRGYILAAFEEVGLPPSALSYALEELESGRDAYLVAAAAKGLRGLAGPTAQIVPYLLKAIENIRNADDAVSFTSYRPSWPVADETTALREILRTFVWLGACAAAALPNLEELGEGQAELSAATRAVLGQARDSIRSGLVVDDGRGNGAGIAGSASVGAAVLQAQPEGVSAPTCCAAPRGLLESAGRPPVERAAPAVPADFEFEDQDGRRLTYGEFFCRQPSVVTFFYTRCGNPNKCSLTISKLATLQGAMREAGSAGRLRVAAITYDPDFDLARRMKAYGENRGFVFDEKNRFLRTRSSFALLSESFQLAVNFSQALVNRHAVELFVLDEEGRVTATFSRLQWDVRAVLDRARQLLPPSATDDVAPSVVRAAAHPASIRRVPAP